MINIAIGWHRSVRGIFAKIPLDEEIDRIMYLALSFSLSLSLSLSVPARVTE